MNKIMIFISLFVMLFFSFDAFANDKEEIEKQAYEKLDQALTHTGIGTVEICMGVLAIAEGYIAGGVASCSAGGYAYSDAFEEFKEAKELFEESRKSEEGEE